MTAGQIELVAERLYEHDRGNAQANAAITAKAAP